jgi:hypothetical protein
MARSPSQWTNRSTEFPTVGKIANHLRVAFLAIKDMNRQALHLSTG